MTDPYPQVLISTAGDPVPVIAEHEGAFAPSDAALWRPATGDVYSRYYDYYTGGPGDPDGPWREGCDPESRAIASILGLPEGDVATKAPVDLRAAVLAYAKECEAAIAPLAREVIDSTEDEVSDAMSSVYAEVAEGLFKILEEER